MSTVFEPRLDILPESQLRLWPELDAVPSDFVLYGGTALALQLGHRFSEDFDFFSTSGFDPARLQSRLPFFRDLERDDTMPGCISRQITSKRSSIVEIRYKLPSAAVSTHYNECRTRFVPQDRACARRRCSIWPV